MGVAAAVVAVAAVASTAISIASALSGPPKPPAPPAAPPPPPTAPSMNPGRVAAATQQQTALAAAMSGRQSTVLQQTPTADKLG